MLGLRKREPWKFERYFKLVQKEAAKQKAVFYIDAGCGKDVVTRTLWCSEIFGWLIPKSLPKEAILEFEKVWKENNVSDDWTDYFVCVTYNNPSKPEITFMDLPYYED